jgi:hypothetical protein
MSTVRMVDSKEGETDHGSEGRSQELGDMRQKTVGLL